jgi:hypothetical protein
LKYRPNSHGFNKLVTKSKRFFGINHKLKETRFFNHNPKQERNHKRVQAWIKIKVKTQNESDIYKR